MAEKIKLNMNRNVYLKISVATLIFCAVIFSGAIRVHAANLSFSPASGSYGVGDTIPVQIIVSSQDQSANAVSGTISFPVDKFKVTLLSKNSSIINFWAAEPSFSNTAGTIHFEGVVLSPGFNGAKGLVLTAYFKVISAGAGPLSFSSASVLANDGNGTDITQTIGKAQFTLSNAVVAPVTPPAVIEHANNPSIFSVNEVKRNDQTNPIINLIFVSRGAAIVDHFSVSIDGSAAINVTDPNYTTTALTPGSHGILVKAIYVGGTSLTSTADVVVSPLPTPVITHFTNSLSEDEYITLQGTSLPNTIVEVFLKDQYGKILTQNANVDGQGSFNIVWSSKLPAGSYKITLRAVDARGAQSLISDELSVLVQKSALATWSLGIINIFAILAVFLVLLSGLAFWSVYLWHMLKKFRKNMEKKINKADKDFHQSFTLLFKDVKEHLDSIERAQSKRELTEEEDRFIKKMSSDLDNAETFMSRRLKDINK